MESRLNRERKRTRVKERKGKEKATREERRLEK